MTLARSWIVLGLVLGLGLGEARAEKKVDWSQYLEEPGARTKYTRTSPTVAKPEPKKAKAKPAAKVRQTKKVAAQPKAKRKPAAKRR